MLTPAERSPETSVESAPNAPAVEVTKTSALVPVHLLTTLLMLLPPSDWYVSWSTTLPPSWVKRALNAATTSLK